MCVTALSFQTQEACCSQGTAVCRGLLDRRAPHSSAPRCCDHLILCRPEDPPFIKEAEVLWNPFDDIEPRTTRAERLAAAEQ